MPVTVANTMDTAVSDVSVPAPQASASVDTTAATTTPAQTLSLPNIALLAWAAGAGAGLTYIMVLYGVLRRRIRRNAAPPTLGLAVLFDEIKTDMGIKARLRLVCQYEYGTPALLFPCTVMMPVDALVAMSDEEVRYALRHELMHYKRGDHIMSLLLSVLCAVYWFNPFVWLAARQMRTDMEIACDSAVVSRLDADGKSHYASLIVGLFARPVHRQLVLGMAHAPLRAGVGFLWIDDAHVSRLSGGAADGDGIWR